MRNAKKLIALLLVPVMLVSVLAGCGSKTDADEAATAVIATAVQYTKSGSYTTTVSSDTVELKDLTAENVEVLYVDPVAYAQAVEEYEKTATVDEAKVTEAIVAKTKVDSVSKNDRGGWDIAFTDDKAAEYATSYYQVIFTNLDQYADVDVTFPVMSLSADLEYVTPADHAIKLTMELEGSEFEGEVKPEDITLSDAFSAMKVESVSAAGRNLTVQLTGDLSRNDAGAYQSGTVSVSPAVIKDGYTDVPAEVPVKLESAAFDASTLKYADGKITGDFEIIGVVDPASLTKDNVTIEGVTVEAVELTGDNTVKLTLSADGVKSVNAFADQFGDAEIVLDGYATGLDLAQASFYPVYDYVEADGDRLKLTLKLYAFDGAFSEDVSGDAILFDDGFKDAKVESLTRDSDTLATLILSIPANGMTEENLSVIGTVGIAEGAMINAWGDKTTIIYEYCRDYSPETLGKGFWDSIKNAFSSVGNAIKNGASYVWDKISSGASDLWDRIKTGASNLWDKVKEYAPTVWEKVQEGIGFVWGGFKDGLGTIAEFLGLGNSKQQEQILLGEKMLIDYSKETLAQLGAVRGELASLRTDLAGIKSSVATVLDNQYIIMDKLDKIAKELQILGNSSYRANLRNLQTAIDLVSMTYELGAVYMALEDAVAEGKLAQMPDFSSYTRAQLSKAIEPYRQYLPDVDNMTQKQAADYNDRIIDYIKARAKNDSDTEFSSFNDDYKDLKDALKNIASELAVTDSTNPMARYDEICALTYNFDSQAFEFRAAQRLTAITLMEQAMTLVSSCEKAMNKPMGATYTKMEALVEDALVMISLIPIGYAPEDIKESYDKKPYSYVLKCNVTTTEFNSTTLLDSGAIRRSVQMSGYIKIDGRDWTAAELNTFLNRAGGKTLQQEFTSAGLKLNTPLVIEINVKSEWIESGIRMDYMIKSTGKFLKPDATSAADAYTYSETHVGFGNRLRNPFTALSS